MAVIDSGITTAHDDLTAHEGYDLREDLPTPSETWKQDTSHHGSHVTGVVARQFNNDGIRGFAPDAQIFGFRVFPGGRISWLIAALQRCIDNQIDVVNLSLGADEESTLLHQKIREAKQAGIALIAAAGNSAGAVKFPARWPEVLAVSAIGQQDSFPADSSHQRQIGEHTSSDGQFFTARFTCFGDEIDVCAPGVAIVSCVGEDGYAAWDGTSMACPHVTGLAALMLAHRSDVPALQTRNAERVNKLFALMKQSVQDLGLPVHYQGAGLPDVMAALNLELAGADDVTQQIEKLLEEALELTQELSMDA